MNLDLVYKWNTNQSDFSDLIMSNEQQYRNVFQVTKYHNVMVLDLFFELNYPLNTDSND